jgi:ribA/ribD-fused uncharacterized protein
VHRLKTNGTVGADSKMKDVRENVQTIKFYRANEKPFGAFSNLFLRTVEFEGRLFPTAEHAYQSGKALKPAVRDWILSAPTPALAAMAAHGLYTWDVVPNWVEIKFDRMRAVLRAKFTQHPDLGDLLLSTGSARLVEAGRVNNAVMWRALRLFWHPIQKFRHWCSREMRIPSRRNGRISRWCRAGRLKD